VSELGYPDLPILLVDDEEPALRSMSVVLRSHGMTNTVSLSDSRQVLPTLAEQQVTFVLLDLIMPHVSGQELLEAMVSEHPDVPVVITTAVDEVDTAVECMKSGAFDYIVKPIEEDRLLSAARRAIEIHDLRRENELLRASLRTRAIQHPEAFADILTDSEEMLAVFRYAEAIARTSQPVLIVGETGVGKELIARAIHVLSGRPGEFVPVNVAGVDDTLFADTLFGHVKGAYTGAASDRQGLIERASGGTLFLDEIGDLSPTSQVKLLRLLQEREYLPLGSDVARQTNARTVVATNRDLVALQESDRFRKDLYYRLRAHYVEVPPLRERREDLPVLVDHFLDGAARDLGKKKPSAPAEILDVLGAYHFPGNIRELQALVFDAVSKHVSGILSLDTFKQALGSSGRSPSERVVAEGSVQFGPRLPSLKQARVLLIEEAMRRAKNNQSVAAQLLGVTRQALNKYLKSIETD
jgi:DNA-binding NtrC family response regulator